MTINGITETRRNEEILWLRGVGGDWEN